MIPLEYEGREQAYVKHRLLESYLYKLFMIVGQHHDQISYIDCLAGPWTEGSDKLEGTSIYISLQIMSKCAESLKRMNRNIKFRALYIEKDRDAYARLESFLASEASGVETKSLNGEFYHLRHKILEWAGTEGFAFFFVDPCGWKGIVEPETLQPLFQRPNSEFLVNFMLDFLRRTTGIGVHASDMTKVFGENPQLNGLPVQEKENILVGLYQRHLKAAFPPSTRRARSVSVPVLYPTKDRTYYHLVYLTRHPLGIVKFMTASEESDIIQQQVRAKTKQEMRVQATGQGELFGALEQVRIEGQKVEPEEVRQYWLSKLSTSPRHFDINELAEMLEETGWYESVLQQGFKELLEDGKVRNLDYDGKPKRRTKFVHFEGKGERLVRI